MESTFVQPLEEWRGVHFIMQDDKVVYTRYDTTQLGYEKEEIVGTPMRNIVAPECFEEVAKLHHDVLKKGGREVSYYKTLVVARDGSRIPFQVAVWATTYHDRPAIGGVMALITDEDQATPLPSHDSGDYRSLWTEAGKAGEGIAAFEAGKGKELRCVYANDEIERLSGYSASDLLDMKLGDLFRMGDVGGKKGTPSRYETEIFRKDGNAVPVELCIGMAKLYRQKQVTVIYVRDITERKAWEAETLKLQEDLRFYASQVVKAQEEERRRLSRELHDGTVQTLVVMANKLRTFRGVSHNGADDDLYDMVNHTLSEIRSIIWRLRPPFLDDQGLAPALEWLAGNVSRDGELEVDVVIKGQPRRLPANIELSIFRIAQEAISNVYRHANASSAEVMLEFAEDKVILSISDNGCGFEVPDRMTTLVGRGKLGLIGMNERSQDIGAKLRVDSEPGRGTRIRLEIPAQEFSN